MVKTCFAVMVGVMLVLIGTWAIGLITTLPPWQMWAMLAVFFVSFFGKHYAEFRDEEV